jgi:phage gp37-like protein
MLAEIEQSLVAHIQASPLAERLRAVDALPDLEGDSLVATFGAEAPAVYVALGGGDLANGAAAPLIGVACVARNSRSPRAARQGDGLQIGLLQLVEEVVALLDGAFIDGLHYHTLRWDPVASEALYRKGLYAAVVQLTTFLPLPFVAA